MKIIFWGTPSLAVPSLKKLYESGHDILAVVTQPDSIQGRRKHGLVPSPVKFFAQERQIPVLQPLSPNTSEFIAELRKINPEIMILAAYGKILCKEILDIAPYGFLNIHFSLLPKYRGASPVTAAILAGEKETGVSIIKLVPRMDAGPIYDMVSVAISCNDTRKTLEEKLGDQAVPLLLNVLEKIASNQCFPREQEESQATYCKILSKRDGLIPWQKEAVYLERFVRAMSPWPMAYTYLSQKSSSSLIIIHEAQVLAETYSSIPGTIVHLGREGIDVVTGKECLRILSLQRTGKRAMKAEEFLRGNPLRTGDFFFNGMEGAKRNSNC